MEAEQLIQLELILKNVDEEVVRASELYPPFRSIHEGIAIIEEEFLELRAEVFRKPVRWNKTREEAKQLAAMAIRFLIDLN